MTKVRTYQELIAWQKAMDLVVAVYEQTRAFPKEETYGLTNQLRRAAVSIPSNIAEGQGRNSTKQFQHFLSIAYGSLQEVETQLLIARRLQYLTAEQTDPLLLQCAEVGRIINGLVRSLGQ
ncbi:MAG: four helix bundle protein [Chloroflexales bacterium]